MKVLATLTSWLLLGAGWFAAAPGMAAESVTFQIFVAPGGNDSSAGTAPDKPLASLGQALKLYDGQCKGRVTEIRIATGTYRNERNTLRRAPCALKIGGFANAKPSFDGGGEGSWLVLAMAGAHHVDVTVTGIEVANYQSAVSINGDRSQADGWIGGVRLAGNRFTRIGSFRADQNPATAAVRLVNARNVTIEGNEFQTIRNVRSCGGLHSIYIAHHSSDNLIKGNVFRDGCGDTVKVRDASDNNRVVGNRFEQQEGNALLLDSYCDKNARSDCTKPEGECPSWNNAFEDNVVAGARPASNKELVKARRIQSSLPNCPPPPLRQDRIQERRTSAAR